MSSEVTTTFYASVDQGTERLQRSWPGLLATGMVGGIDVSIGLLALLTVEHATGNCLLGALAFGIGFIALTLAGSELFTENFLVPVNAVVAGQAPLRALFRLWVGTLTANLIGGWVMAGLIMAGDPDLRSTALDTGIRVVDHPIGWSLLAAAILGGTVITLMTWMERSTPSVPAKLVAAVSAAFILGAGPVVHAVVNTLEMFAALQVGAPFGYYQAARILAFVTLGNALGGLGLVTVLRLVQVGSVAVSQERRRPETRQERRAALIPLPHRDDDQEPPRSSRHTGAGD
ncbi:MAG TPA: formate/nitrite transporter family protein [Acidimicrobiales bacterium]|nr:formate/nitrite transporter family protein [Acidimicrobiales bacterium]